MITLPRNWIPSGLTGAAYGSGRDGVTGTYSSQIDYVLDANALVDPQQLLRGQAWHPSQSICSWMLPLAMPGIASTWICLRQTRVRCRCRELCRCLSAHSRRSSA